MELILPVFLQWYHSKIKIQIKEVHTKEAEKIISAFNKPNIDDNQYQKTKSSEKSKSKSKKISKK